jgi:2-polyprenyl-3-methyl-5-hydroxy-6-metoxy-1,4-benzoquinol methylase
MMFGFRETFRYFQCCSCGCLQIAEVPSDLSRYYPPEYYSFAPLEEAFDFGRNWGRRKLARMRNEAAFFGRGMVGRLINKLRPMSPGVAQQANELIGLRRLGKRYISPKTRILDVGCGQGAALWFLRHLGFQRLCGVDPFIPKDLTDSNGVRILKKSIHDLDETFDIVTFHHSFEHMADPLAVLRSVHRILSADGQCLIRIPVANSYAWERYGVHWVQLDAPRHLFIHSVKSMETLAAQAGLRVAEVAWDSTEFQFWGSEQYLRDIPLRADASYATRPEKSIFSARQIAEFRTQATELNTLGRGDQAAFFLVKQVNGDAGAV